MSATFIADLRTRYGDALSVRRVGTETLACIRHARLPRRNVHANALVVIPDGCFESGQRPAVYAGEDTVQPNGRRGRNVNATQVHGETWLAFSWSFEWDSKQPGWTLVEGALRRFSINDD